jgi:hypothetical protein
MRLLIVQLGSIRASLAHNNSISVKAYNVQMEDFIYPNGLPHIGNYAIIAFILVGVVFIALSKHK